MLAYEAREIECKLTVLKLIKGTTKWLNDSRQMNFQAYNISLPNVSKQKHLGSILLNI